MGAGYSESLTKQVLRVFESQEIMAVGGSDVKGVALRLPAEILTPPDCVGMALNGPIPVAQIRSTNIEARNKSE